VYFLALLRVPDIDRYRREYGRQLVPMLAAAGAKILVASPSPTVLEGHWEPTWTALIQFPDRGSAMQWYESEAYAPLKRLRLQELSTGGAVALFDGYQPTTSVP
jgi:uncharacterized protein (DUF1330 family)